MTDTPQPAAPRAEVSDGIVVQHYPQDGLPYFVATDGTEWHQALVGNDGTLLAGWTRGGIFHAYADAETITQAAMDAINLMIPSTPEVQL